MSSAICFYATYVVATYMLYIAVAIVYYSTATENGSAIRNGFTNPLPPLKRVSFSHLPVSLEEISTTNDKATAQKSSILSLSEFKLIHYKLIVAFGICCIVVLFMLPVIFYYVEGGGSEVSDNLSVIGIGIVNISQVSI